jgi:hypothetical protein
MEETAKNSLKYSLNLKFLLKYKITHPTQSIPTVYKQYSLFWTHSNLESYTNATFKSKQSKISGKTSAVHPHSYKLNLSALWINHASKGTRHFLIITVNGKGISIKTFPYFLHSQITER